MEEIYCFGENPLDRMSERRDDGEWIAALLADGGTRMLPLRDLKPLVAGTAPPPSLSGGAQDATGTFVNSTG